MENGCDWCKMPKHRVLDVRSLGIGGTIPIRGPNASEVVEAANPAGLYDRLYGYLY